MTTENKKTFADLKPFIRLDEFIADRTYGTFCHLPGESAAEAKEHGKHIMRILRRADAAGLVKVEIKLLPSELLDLEAAAKRCDVAPADILEQFVADLTGSGRTSGSDERDMAEQYFRRTNLAAPIWMHELDRQQEAAIAPEVAARFKQAYALDEAADSIRRRGF